jgi:hypothetical protein
MATTILGEDTLQEEEYGTYSFILFKRVPVEGRENFLNDHKNHLTYYTVKKTETENPKGPKYASKKTTTETPILKFKQIDGEKYIFGDESTNTEIDANSPNLYYNKKEVKTVEQLQKETEDADESMKYYLSNSNSMPSSLRTVGELSAGGRRRRNSKKRKTKRRNFKKRRSHKRR